MTGIIRPQNASLKALQRSAAVALGTRFKSAFLVTHMDARKRAKPIRSPGIMPDINSVPTDTLAMEL